jgi:hypothetical protein
MAATTKTSGGNNAYHNFVSLLEFLAALGHDGFEMRTLSRPLLEKPRDHPGQQTGGTWLTLLLLAQ